MDVSTELVQAYLHVNGYFTATDYPLLETRRRKPSRMVTDIDVLAVRFAQPHGKTEHGPASTQSVGITGPVAQNIDPVLKSPVDRTDMIVAEVKQGLARVNPAARNKRTLVAALERFGCCDSDHAPDVVARLLADGSATSPDGHVVRMVLFASRGEGPPRGWHWLHLGHVVTYLSHYMQRREDLLKHADLHDRALNWLSLLQKCNLTVSHKRRAD